VPTTGRTIEGRLFAHGGQVFAFVKTMQPYDIPGCAAAVRRARALSDALTGQIQLRIMENPAYPGQQGFALLPNGRGIRRKQFEDMVHRVFPNCSYELEWITDIDDLRLFFALIARESLEGL
jgi:hypothetical protein